jgi:hypothetical protein
VSGPSGRTPTRGAGRGQWQRQEMFHGVLHDSEPDPASPALSVLTGRATTPPRYSAASRPGSTAWAKDPRLRQRQPRVRLPLDQPRFLARPWRNPFGHSGRRIGDYYAGLVGDFRRGQDWQRFRVTPHDHKPVNDAMGNVEAFETIQRLHREGRLR